MSDLNQEAVNEQIDEEVTQPEVQTEEPAGSEAQGKPEDKILEELNNLKAALREEREKRKELRDQNEQLRQYMEGLNKPKEDNLDPDEFLTVGDVQKLLEKERQRIAQDLQAQQSQQIAFQTKLVNAEVQARQKYPDYDETIKELQPILAENAALQKALMADPERAPDLAYTFAKGLKAQKMTDLNKKEVAQSLMKQNQPQTMGTRGTGTRNTPVRDVSNMTIDEYTKYVESLTPEERNKLIGA